MLESILESKAFANAAIVAGVVLVIVWMYPEKARGLLSKFRCKAKPAPAITDVGEAEEFILALQIISLSKPTACRDSCLDALDILAKELGPRQDNNDSPG